MEGLSGGSAETDLCSLQHFSALPAVMFCVRATFVWPEICPEILDTVGSALHIYLLGLELWNPVAWINNKRTNNNMHLQNIGGGDIL